MRKAVLAATLLVSLAAATAAHAETLTPTLKPGMNSKVKIWYNTKWMTVRAGPFSATLDAGLPFDAYCVDLDHWNTNGVGYEVTPTSTGFLTNGTGGAANGEGIGWLYHTFAGSVDTPIEGAAL